MIELVEGSVDLYLVAVTQSFRDVVCKLAYLQIYEKPYDCE